MKYTKRSFSGLTKRDEQAVLQYNNIVVVGSIKFAKASTLLNGLKAPPSFLEQLKVNARTCAGTVILLHGQRSNC